MVDILLVGGGHTHLGILQRIRMKAVDYQVTLISASTYQYYSGMFSGFTEGLYSEQGIRINLKELSGVTFIKDTIVNVDATNRKLVGTTGIVYDFKLVSFDIGSSVGSFDGSIKQIEIKPNFVFPKEINTFRETAFPVVVGGGLQALKWHCRFKRGDLIMGINPMSQSSALRHFYLQSAKKPRPK